MLTIKFPTYAPFDIIAFSEAYKNEVTMKSRDAYVSAICKNIGLEFGVDMVLFLMHSATMPYIDVIKRIPLKNAIDQLCDQVINLQEYNSYNRKFYVSEFKRSALKMSPLIFSKIK